MWKGDYRVEGIQAVLVTDCKPPGAGTVCVPDLLKGGAGLRQDIPLVICSLSMILFTHKGNEL
jgi:hypothetical protein